MEDDSYVVWNFCRYVNARCGDNPSYAVWIWDLDSFNGNIKDPVKFETDDDDKTVISTSSTVVATSTVESSTKVVNIN